MRAIVMAGLSAALCAMPGSATAADAWQVVDQPDLERQLAAAPKLEPTIVADAPKSIMPWGTIEVPNRDGKTYDLITYYIKAYTRNSRAYITDLGTGEMRLQTFDETERRQRPELITWTLHWDGNLYGATPDGPSKAMWIYKYDPDKNAIEKFLEVPNIGGEKFDTALGVDGRIYGTGTVIDGELREHAAAYSFDPKTKDVRDYGKVGAAHPEGAYGYSMGVDDTHIYVASGQIPWYLMAVNIKTGEQKVLLEGAPGSYKDRMWVHGQYPGAWVMFKEDDASPVQEFWLYHGEAIPKTEGSAPPWEPKESPLSNRPPAPDVYEGQLDPDPQGNATLWVQEPGEKDWKPIPFKGIETYPLDVFRLINLPNDLIFGTSGGYNGRFLFDPKTNKLESLGRGGSSIYALAVHGDRLYWSGYPSAMIFEYDWTKPWTLDKPAPPGASSPKETDPNSNPRKVGELYSHTRVKKIMSATTGADGRVYFGGTGQRDYVGGGFGWYDPATKETGGMWRPFSGWRPHWLSPAQEGRVILISTRTESDELNNNQVPESARVFAFDTGSHKLNWHVEPVKGAIKAGPVVEVSPGRLMGITEDPEVKGGGVLYGLDGATGEVLFRRKLPRTLNFPWAQGYGRWDFKVGPDGFVWTYLGETLVRINPKDTQVRPVGQMPSPGQLTFHGNSIYLTQADGVRRLPLERLPL